MEKKDYIIILSIFIIISIIYTWPIFQNINNMGVFDWDYFSSYHEIARSSIINFKQIPLWTPYHCGGNILFAYPLLSIPSLPFFLILLFGTIIGLKIGILLHLIIGLFGMFLLCRHFKLDISSSFLAAFVFLLSSQYALQLSMGNISYFGITLLPYLLLFYLKSIRDIKFLILAVLILALIAFNGANYEFIMIILFIFIYSLFKLFFQKNNTIIKILMLILILTFLLGSLKFLLILDVMIENPDRLESYNEANNLKTFFTGLLDRNQAEISKNDLYNAYATPIKNRPLPPWQDYGMYIGIIPLILIILSLFSKFKEKWILIATSIIFLILYFGSASPINLWGFLHLFPIFNSLRIISRFHWIFIFTFSILTGMGLSTLKSILKNKGILKICSMLIVLFILLDLILVNSPIFKGAFVNNIEIDKEKNNFHQILNNYSYNNYSESSIYFAYLKNEGTLNCHENFYIASAVSAIDSKSKLYKGEFYLKEGNGNISLIYFSPNKIKVHLNISKKDLLVINQNYHKGWKVKEGEVKPYYGLISANVEKGEYNLIFYYLPNIFLIGSLISILTILLMIYLYKHPINLNYKLLVILILISILLISYIYYENTKFKIGNEYYKKIIKEEDDQSVIKIPYLNYQDKIASIIKEQPGLYFLRSPNKFNDDIVKQGFEAQRSILNYYKFKWIIVYKQFFRYNLLYNQKYEYSPYWAQHTDFYQESKNLIENNLKISSYYEDENIVIYKIEDFEVVPFLLLGEGWHKIEYWDNTPSRWIEDEAFIKIFAPEEIDIKLDFRIMNFYNSKTLEVYLNKDLIKESTIKEMTKVSLKLKLNKGENILKLSAKEGCLKPYKVSKSADTRCLSFNIKDVKIRGLN